MKFDTASYVDECDFHATTGAWGYASMTSADTYTTDNFCTFKNRLNSGDLGCETRYQPDGSHYYLGFVAQYDMWTVNHHDSNHQEVTAINTWSGGTNPCNDYAGDTCDWSDGDPAPGDWLGAYVTGTGTNTAVQFFDFGTTDPNGLGSPHDPTTWGSYLSCECSAAEIADQTFTEIDSAGGCGPEGHGQSPATETSHPKMDTFKCGDVE